MEELIKRLKEVKEYCKSIGFISQTTYDKIQGNTGEVHISHPASWDESVIKNKLGLVTSKFKKVTSKKSSTGYIFEVKL